MEQRTERFVEKVAQRIFGTENVRTGSGEGAAEIQKLRAQAEQAQKKAEELTAQLQSLEGKLSACMNENKTNTHDVGVRIYRNVQASVIEEQKKQTGEIEALLDEKQKEQTGELEALLAREKEEIMAGIAKAEAEKTGGGAVPLLLTLTLLLSAANLAILLLHILGYM